MLYERRPLRLQPNRGNLRPVSMRLKCDPQGSCEIFSSSQCLTSESKAELTLGCVFCRASSSSSTARFTAQEN